MQGCTAMKKILFALVPLVCAASFGCTNRYQQQVDQSLLLQENRRLEEALYVTHAQLVDLKRENEALRNLDPGETNGRSSSAPAPRSRRRVSAPADDYDDAPPYQVPEITIPPEGGSSTLPDALKGVNMLPKPVLPKRERTVPVPEPSESAPQNMTFPELIIPDNQVGDSTPPAWSPTR